MNKNKRYASPLVDLQSKDRFLGSARQKSFASNKALIHNEK